MEVLALPEKKPEEQEIKIQSTVIPDGYIHRKR